MKLIRPPQISSVPEIDSAAMAAVGGSFDTLERLLSQVNAIAFFQSTATFAASSFSGLITFSNLARLRLPNGTYATPQVVLTGCGQATAVGKNDIAITVVSVSAGGCSVILWTPSAAFTDNVNFWLLLIA